GDAALNLLRRIVAAAMLDRVRERFAQRELNLELFTHGAAHLVHDRHDLVDDRRDGSQISRKGQVELDQQIFALEIALRERLGSHGCLPRIRLRTPEAYCRLVLPMKSATSVLNAFSEGSFTYIIWPAG